MKNPFKKDPEIEKILSRAEFLLKSPILNNKKYITAKTVKRMIEKLIEN